MSDEPEKREMYGFFVVALFLYITVTLIVFLLVNAVPESKVTGDFVDLEKRMIELERRIPPPKNAPPFTSSISSTDTKLTELAVRLSILENKSVELEKRLTDRTIRIESKTGEIESSTKWQIAIIWGIIIALAAAILPLRLGR